LSKLRHARFHIQEREMAFATGRFVRYAYFRSRLRGGRRGRYGAYEL
jgi:hypothetical protein